MLDASGAFRLAEDPRAFSVLGRGRLVIGRSVLRGLLKTALTGPDMAERRLAGIARLGVSYLLRPAPWLVHAEMGHMLHRRAYEPFEPPGSAEAAISKIAEKLLPRNRGLERWLKGQLRELDAQVISPPDPKLKDDAEKILVALGREVGLPLRRFQASLLTATRKVPLCSAYVRLAELSRPPDTETAMLILEAAYSDALVSAEEPGSDVARTFAAIHPEKELMRL